MRLFIELSFKKARLCTKKSFNYFSVRTFILKHTRTKNSEIGIVDLGPIISKTDPQVGPKNQWDENW